MDLSNIKLVVTDMDGTLLNSNHEVSNRFFTLFEELKNRGILFAAASGRQYNSIVDKLHPIKDDIIVIAENGGFAMENDTELVSNPLENASKSIILKALEGINDIHPVLCGKKNSYLTGHSDSFTDLLRQYYSKFEIVEDLTKVNSEVLKVAVYHFESSEQYIYPLVKHLEGQLKVKISGQNWVDISSPNAHKGFALQKVQELHNISPAETLVFGDYNNDLEMLALADYSFAMANAHPDVKSVANYTTLNNDEFGVEVVLERLLNL